jgi:hypothetical protein
MPIVPNLTPHGNRVRRAATARKPPAAAPAAVTPIYWPFVDSMYDYLAFLTAGATGQGPPIATPPAGSAPPIGLVGARAGGQGGARSVEQPRENHKPC